MSRNLCDTKCHHCGLDEVIIVGPEMLWINHYPDWSDHYKAVYHDQFIADAECAYCGAKYVAWTQPSSQEYYRRHGRGWMVYGEDTPREKQFYDLSYRANFNDEPKPEDLPEKPFIPPVVLKKHAEKLAEICLFSLTFYERLLSGHQWPEETIKDRIMEIKQTLMQKEGN